MFGINKNYVRP